MRPFRLGYLSRSLSWYVCARASATRLINNVNHRGSLGLFSRVAAAAAAAGRPAGRPVAEGKEEEGGEVSARNYICTPALRVVTL